MADLILGKRAVDERSLLASEGAACRAPDARESKDIEPVDLEARSSATRAKDRRHPKRAETPRGRHAFRGRLFYFG